MACRHLDADGNVPLHFAVLHNNPEMYLHLVNDCEASEDVRNAQGLTPVMLAARLGAARRRCCRRHSSATHRQACDS